MENSKSKTKSKSLDAGARMSFMKVMKNKNYRDYFLNTEDTRASKYFNPRHFQIQSFLQRSDLILLVEHCSLCDSHTDILRHDERKYYSEANKLLRSVSQTIHSKELNIRLGVVRVPVLPNESTVGCFEVSIIYQNRSGQYFNKLLYSKKQMSKFPVVEKLEAKIDEFISNANIVSTPLPSSVDTATYLTVGSDGMSSYPVGGRGPWEATPVGSVDSWKYPPVLNLLAAPIANKDIQWVFDSRIDENLLDVPPVGAVVWVRSVPCVAAARPVAAGGPPAGVERHPQLGIVVSPPFAVVPASAASSSAVSSSPSGAVSSVSSKAASSKAPMMMGSKAMSSRRLLTGSSNSGSPSSKQNVGPSLQVKLKYHDDAIVVKASQCVTDSEHVPMAPYDTAEVPLELEMLLLLKLLYGDSVLDTEISGGGSATEPGQGQGQGQGQGSGSPLQWRVRCAGDVQQDDGRVLLTRPSAYHQIRSLAFGIEQLLLADGRLTSESCFIRHKETGKQVDLQLAYSEPVLDWMFHYKSTDGKVDMQLLQEEMLSTYQTVKKQSTKEVPRKGTPGVARSATSWRMERDESSSPTCEIGQVSVSRGEVVELFRGHLIGFLDRQPFDQDKVSSDEQGDVNQFRWMCACLRECLLRTSVDLQFILNPQLTVDQTGSVAPGSSQRLSECSDYRGGLRSRSALVSCLDNCLASLSGNEMPASQYGFDPRCLIKLFHLVNTPVSYQLESYLCQSIGIDGLNYISSSRLAQFLIVPVHLRSREVCELWSPCRLCLLGVSEVDTDALSNAATVDLRRSAKWPRLLEALTSEGLSAYLQAAADPMQLPGNWMRMPEAFVHVDAFASILQQLEVSDFLSDKDLELLLFMWSAAKKTISYETVCIGEDSTTLPDCECDCASVLPNDVDVVNTGSDSVALVQWFQFLCWLNVVSTDSIEVRLARVAEVVAAVQQVVQQSSFRNTPMAGTPIAGSPLAAGRKQTGARPVRPLPIGVSYEEESVDKEDDGGDGEGVDAGGSLYGGDWDNESSVDYSLSGGQAVRHAGHSGYSQYDGNSICSADQSEIHMNDKEWIGSSRSRVSIGDHDGRRSRPGKDADDLSVLQDLISEIDEHISVERVFIKSQRDRIQSARVKADSRSGSVCDDRDPSNSPPMRAKSAGHKKGGQNSNPYKNHWYPKQLTLTSIQLSGLLLREIVASHVQERSALKVVIEAGDSCLTGAVELSTVDLSHASVAVSCRLLSAVDLESFDEATAHQVALDLRSLKYIQLSLEVEGLKAVQGSDSLRESVALSSSLKSVTLVEPVQIVSLPVSEVASAAVTVEATPTPMKPDQSLVQELIREVQVAAEIAGEATTSHLTAEGQGACDSTIEVQAPVDSVNDSQGVVEGVEASVTSQGEVPVSAWDEDAGSLSPDFSRSQVVSRCMSPVNCVEEVASVEPKMDAEAQQCSTVDKEMSLSGEVPVVSSEVGGGAASGSVDNAPAAVDIRRVPSDNIKICLPIDLSTRRFNSVMEDSFSLDFDVFPTLLTVEGEELMDKREKLRVSIFGLAKDFDHISHHIWSAARTPHFAIMNRLPPNLSSIIKPNSSKAGGRQLPTHSHQTPWFPAAVNNTRQPGKTPLHDHRPLSPSWHPVALNNRDPFAKGRVWKYSDEMKARMHLSTASMRGDDESLAPSLSVDSIGRSYGRLKEESTVSRPKSPSGDMKGIFLARNKYSGGESRPIPPLPAKKPPVPHFEWTKPSTTKLFLRDEDEPQPFVPPPRRSPTPTAAELISPIKSPSATNLTDGPFYAHNRFQTSSSSIVPSRLGSSIPRWPEIKQGTGNMAKPRKVLIPHIKMRDSPSHYKLL